LGRQLGTEVVPVLSRKEQSDPALRAQALTETLCRDGVLTGAIRIPDTAGHLVVFADLRASKVTCYVDVEAPREGRPTTRVNWLLRQLKNAPADTRVEAFVQHGRGSSTAALLAAVREDPAVLVADATRELRSFRVAVSSGLGTKRGRGRGSFIDSVLTAVDGYYAEVLGSLRAWSATPPKLRPSHPAERDLDSTVAAALVSTDYSSQDDPETRRGDPDDADGADGTYHEREERSEQDASKNPVHAAAEPLTGPTV
jgi:hypothetical protein